MNKNQPTRTCIACRCENDKKNLLRIVKNKQNEIFIDYSGKADGRGAYVCKNCECIKKLNKGKILNKVFKMQIDENVYHKLEEDFVAK